MSDNSKNSINNLNSKVLNQLLKRFNEQKGIIHAYIQKEREWKKHKLFRRMKLKNLKKINSKLIKVIKIA